MDIIEIFYRKLKLECELYHVVVTTAKTSPEKSTLTVAEMQQLPDIENTASMEEFFFVKWTKSNGRRNKYVKFMTDRDKLNLVMNRYRTNCTS